ncbi:MAG: RNA 2',3'-cyclic phosphodiesterase [Balneolaceae bacterium]|nr:MAG: RNA 2',3'-cyclic phosphodiesterase [Balneolaceae bacterium]
MIRLFTAVQLPDHIREAIPIPDSSGIKTVSEENLHITLRYLGEIRRERVQELRNALRTVSFNPFAATAAGTGCFPNRRNPAVLWVGVEPAGQIEALFYRIEDALNPLGYGPEKRRFHPHITVARPRPRAKKAAIDFLDQYSDFSAGEFAIDEFVLYESILRREGPEYRMVEVYGGG